MLLRLKTVDSKKYKMPYNPDFLKTARLEVSGECAANFCSKCPAAMEPVSGHVFSERVGVFCRVQNAIVRAHPETVDKVKARTKAIFLEKNGVELGCNMV